MNAYIENYQNNSKYNPATLEWYEDVLQITVNRSSGHIKVDPTRSTVDGCVQRITIGSTDYVERCTVGIKMKGINDGNSDVTGTVELCVINDEYGEDSLTEYLKFYIEHNSVYDYVDCDSGNPIVVRNGQAKDTSIMLTYKAATVDVQSKSDLVEVASAGGDNASSMWAIKTPKNTTENSVTHWINFSINYNNKIAIYQLRIVTLAEEEYNNPIWRTSTIDYPVVGEYVDYKIEDDGRIIYSGRAYSVDGMASIDIQDIVADYLECNKLFEPTNRNYGKIFNIYIGNDATPIKYGYYNSWSYGDEVLYIEDAYVLHRPIKTSIPCGVRLPISVFCPNRIPAIRNDVKIMGIEK